MEVRGCGGEESSVELAVEVDARLPSLSPLTLRQYSSDDNNIGSTAVSLILSRSEEEVNQEPVSRP